MTEEIKSLAIKAVIDFCDWYFDSEVDRHNIGGDYFGVWGLNDEFWDFSDIIRALDNQGKVTPDELSKWYWDNVESEQKINLNTFLMGES